MPRSVALVLALAVLLPTSVPAQDMAMIRRSAVLAVATEVLAPRYDALEDEAARQSSAWDGVCRDPRRLDAGRPRLAEAFRAAASAWSAIELLRYGPAAEDLRLERMAHWPERRNAVGRGLSALLTRDEAPDAARLRQASVAVQGLSALERLVFPQPGETAGVDPRRICAVGIAIARNVATMAAEMREGWRGPGGVLAALERADEATIREAATCIVTDHLTMLEAAADTKLGTVLGGRIDKANPRAAEGWRAGRTGQALAANLSTARALSRIVAPPKTGGAARALDAGYAAAEQALANLGGTALGEAAARPRERRQVVLVRDLVASVRAQSETLLPERLGVVVGFNSRDGD